MSTVLLNKNSIWTVKIFCFADNSILLPFPTDSCDPFVGNVHFLIGFCNHFFSVTLLLFFVLTFERLSRCIVSQCWTFAVFSSKLHTIFSRLLGFTAITLMSSLKFTEVIWTEYKHWNTFDFANANHSITKWLSSNVAFSKDFAWLVFNLPRNNLFRSSMRLELSCSNLIWFCKDEFSSPPVGILESLRCNWSHFCVEMEQNLKFSNHFLGMFSFFSILCSYWSIFKSEAINWPRILSLLLYNCQVVYR